MTQFWTDVLSNFLATASGLILGVPAGLWLDRYIRARNEREKSLETKRREYKILRILRSELSEDTKLMNQIHRDFANEYYPVRLESWRSFSDGGELQWIDDPGVLHSLASAYASVAQYSFLLDKCVEGYYFPGSQGNRNLQDVLLGLTIKKRDFALIEIEMTIKVLDAKLGLLAKEVPDLQNAVAA